MKLVLIVIALLGIGVNLECVGLSGKSPDFSSWNKVLRDCVLENQTDPVTSILYNAFNYSNLVENFDFQRFICQVENADTNSFLESETLFKSFWINVYNFMAVKIVYENHCKYDLFGNCSALTSIRNIGQQQPSVLPTQTWGKPYLTITFKNESKTYSLDEVEVSLRCPPNEWKEDVRLHAALVCASISCPNLRNSAYSSDAISLEANLSDAMTNFLSQENKYKGADIVNNKLWVSSIFNFFPDDFNATEVPKQKCGGNSTPSYSNFNVTSLLNTYGTSNIKTWLKNNNNTYTLNYFDYDWRINGNLKSLCKTTRPCFNWVEGLVILICLIGFLIGVLMRMRRFKYEGYAPVNT